MATRPAQEENPLLRRFLREWEFPSKQIDPWNFADQKGKGSAHQYPNVVESFDGPGPITHLAEDAEDVYTRNPDLFWPIFHGEQGNTAEKAQVQRRVSSNNDDDAEDYDDMPFLEVD